MNAHSPLIHRPGRALGLARWIAAIGLLAALPFAALAEPGGAVGASGPSAPVSIMTQLVYLCGGVATVVLAIIAFLVVGKCKNLVVHLGESPTPEGLAELRRSVNATVSLGAVVAAGYLYLTYYAVMVLATTIKLPRFAYMLAFVCSCATLVGLFMVWFGLRARRGAARFQ
jgi:hypothetical protein